MAYLREARSNPGAIKKGSDLSRGLTGESYASLNMDFPWKTWHQNDIHVTGFQPTKKSW